jgi:glycosyltransferase involved in cell wall biosynthesis
VSKRSSTALPDATSRMPVNVAISGIRGVPANFGGSETAVEEIGTRLAREGHSVAVYCRRHNSDYSEPTFHGMRRVVLPSVNTFQLDTITHSTVSALHLRFRGDAEVVHFHGIGNALVLPLLRGSGIKTVITIDGLDWERPKWGRVASWMLRKSADFAVKYADHLIIDNHPARSYFKEHYGASSSYVVYGADFNRPSSSESLDNWNLSPNRYLLSVGALVPDKGPDLLIKAYRNVKSDLPLVIVGDSPFLPEYRAELQRLAEGDDRVKFLGYVYGDQYRELLANCTAYAHPLRADGTSPALLQAMAYRACIIINSLPEALSAAGDGALPFRHNDIDDLTEKLQLVLDKPEVADEYRDRAFKKARTDYDWDVVTQAHLRIYTDLSVAA